MDRVYRILFICAYLGVGVSVVYGKELPSFIEKCKLNDPQQNDCMKKAIMNFKKYLATGLPEMKIPAFDPYILPKADIETSWLNGSLTNLKLYNSHDYEVDNFDMDLDRGRLELNFTIGYMLMKARYDIDGKILQFTLHGEGELEGKINDTKASIILDGKKIQKKGQEYFQITDVYFKLRAEPKSWIYLHDLFKDNPEITERVNEVIQENQDSLYKDILPIVERIVTAIDLSLFKSIFNNYSLKELFN